MSKLPTQLIDFSVYNQNSRIIGAGDEITLPDIAFKCYTASLAAGDMDFPSLQTENMEFEIPFNVFDDEAASVISVNKVTSLTLRECLQSADTETHDLKYSGLKVSVRGFAKEVNLGTIKRADKMDSKIKLSLSYIKVEGDGKTYLELDKFNGTYIVNGVDIRAGIEKYL